MRFAEDYVKRIPELLKNPEEWEQLKQDAAAITVPSCPCCGGEAVIKLATIYHESIVLYIACSSCGIQTKNSIAGQVWTGEYFTLSDVLAKAAALWSRRV